MTAGTGTRERKPSLLGEFLRAHRAQLRPADLGLPQRGRRRTPGLRREELAQLCGISPTWYTWIEQGRTTAVSAQTLDALAQGLRLGAAERAYLFELAGRADPARPSQAPAESLELGALVRAIRTPAYVLDRYWNAIAWNRPAAALFTDWLGGVQGHGKDQGNGRSRAGAGTGARDAAPNLLRYVFLHPGARRFLVDWEDRAWRLAAEFRADMPRLRDDPRRDALVEELCAVSPEFAEAWRSQQVLARDGGQRAFRRAGGGEVLQFEQHILRVARRPELRMTVLVPR